MIFISKSNEKNYRMTDGFNFKIFLYNHFSTT